MNKRILFLMAAIAMAGSLFAQHNEEVTVEGTYRPKVNKVAKIKLSPEKPQQTFTMPSSEVQPKLTDRKFDIELDKLGAMAYSNKDDKTVQPAQNFLMAGLGTRLSPLFLYRHDSPLTKDVNLGVGISHFSSWVNMKDHPKSGFMNNLCDVKVDAKLQSHQLTGKVFYKNDLYHYYGYRLSDSLIPTARIDELCPKTVNNIIGVSAMLSSTETQLQQLQHAIGVDYRYAFGRAVEHYAALNGHLAWTDSWWGNRAYPQEVGMDLGLQYDHYNNAEALQNEPKQVSRFLLDVNPYFAMKGDFYKLHLGFRFDYTSADSVKICFRPDLQGSLYVFDKKLEFYAGLGGGKQLNTAMELFEANPFISTRAYHDNYQNVRLSFDAGLRTIVADKVGLHAGVRYRKTANDFFFVQDENSMAAIYNVFNQYRILYDNTERVSVVADVRWKIIDGLQLELGGAYNSVKTEREEKAWYRPAFEGNLKVDYALNEQLSFNANLLYKGGIYAKVYKGYNIWESEKLKDIVDLSLGADFKLNDKVTIFGKLNNVANCKYPMYYDYPVTGIEFFAGVKMKF